MEVNVILHGDALEKLKTLPDKCVHCCVTSPPYYNLRDYKVKGQIGLEDTPEEFIQRLVEVFREVRRVLRDDGTIWVNMGDSYASKGKNRTKEMATRKSGLKYGLLTQEQSLVQKSKITGDYKAKDLMGMPWALAFALRNDGWTLRQDIIWHKKNSMPESANDRCSKNHEYIFLLSKNNKRTLLWRHKYSLEWVYKKPTTIYDEETNELIWNGYTYYYDQISIATPLSESTKNDYRVKAETYSSNRPERGFVGSPNGGSGMLQAKYKKPDAWAQGDGVNHNSIEWATEEGQGQLKNNYKPNQPGAWSNSKYFKEGSALPDGRSEKSIQNFQERHGDVIGKGNRKTFRGGGKYTHDNAFDNSGPVENDSAGNTENITGLANKRSVWTVATYGFKDAHFATFPSALIIDCIKAGCPVDGIVLDPFFGAGTTGLVARKLGRNFIGIELNEKYINEIAIPRLKKELGLFY